TTIGFTVGLLIFMFIIYGMFNNGVEFFPSTEPSQALVNITLPIGTKIENTDRVTKQVEQKLVPYKDIEYYVSSVGTEIGGGFSGGANKSNVSTITLNFKDKDKREQSSFKTIEEIRNSIEGLSTADIRIQKQQGGPPTGPPVNIELSGDDFIQLGKLSDQIKEQIKDIPGLKDLKDDFNEARPEIKITIDREKAALYKLTTTSIAMTIRTAINGTAASKFRVGKDEYDITVRLDQSQRDNVSAIEDLFIANKDNKNVPLTSVAKIDFAGGIEAINRKDQKRVVTISANAEGRLGNDVLNDVKVRLAGFKLPGGYNIVYTGESKDQEESSSFLGKAFMMSLLLIFLFMVMEFNSVRTPIIIMFSVLLSLIGVFLGLLLTRTPFGIIMTGIGVISLGGIVVRNAIVMLDFQKELMKRG